MLYENDKDQGEMRKLVAEPSGEFIAINGFPSEKDIHEEDNLDQEIERLSSIIHIEESDDLSASSPGTSTWPLSNMFKALIAICGASAVGAFLYKLFHRDSQRNDFLSTLPPHQRQEAKELLENIAQFTAMTSTPPAGRMTTKESLLRLLVNSSFTGYPGRLESDGQSTSVQTVNVTPPYTLPPSVMVSHPKSTIKPKTETPNVATRQRPTAPSHLSHYSPPLLDKQELDNIYQREQRVQTRKRRSISRPSESADSADSAEKLISYKQAIQTLLLDKVSSAKHADYKEFLKAYADDFFDHYVDFTPEKLKKSTLTIHLYNVFNTIFVKKLATKKTKLSEDDFFVLHALLNLSLALKNTAVTNNQTIKQSNNQRH